MSTADNTVGVNIENVIYTRVQNQTLAPELKMPDSKGDSLSRSVVEPPQSPDFVLKIDEHLIAMQRSGELTKRFDEAYDEEARQDDEEFVRHLKRYHRRRFSDEW